MKVVLILVLSGVANGTDIEFRHQIEKQYSDLKECVQTSILMRKVLRAEDNLQARQTDLYAHCEVSREALSAEEYAAAKNKIRRLEKFFSSEKW